MSRRTAYPLSWPDGWPRTKRHQSSRFRTTLAGALKNVEESLRLFARDSGKKLTDVLISSNVSLGEQNPADAGVAVYFTWDELPTCIAVDSYARVEDNLQAIHHCLEAERVKLRHGGINLVRAAFRGYARLPPPSVSKRPWHEVLGVSPTAGHTQIEDAYRKLRSKRHPDKGGSAAEFDELQRAYAEARG